jgi:branched-subunit amino acid transport protein
MSDLSVWLLFLAVGLGTFALRFSFVGLHGRLRINPTISRALAYVPSSMLAALVFPAVFLAGQEHQFVIENPRIPAAIVAAIVAWKSHNILLTLLAGMGTLWVLQAL